jgi:hypothetical protein
VIDHNYQQILIVNTSYGSNLDLPIEAQAQTQAHVIIYSDGCHNYAYRLKLPNQSYRTLLAEASYLLYSFEQILNSTEHPIVLHVENNKNKESDKDVYVLNDPLKPINWDFLISYRNDHLRQLMNRLDESNRLRLAHIIDKYPYEQTKEDFQLSLNNYLDLCLNLHRFNYYDRLKIRVKPTKTHDLSEIYFDRDFYFRMYPCYQTVLTRDNEPFQHFVNHGIKEKLLPNQTIFEMTRYCQDYLTQTLLNTVTPSSSDNQPIIYILTRTCDRPQLFKSCVNSILNQHYPNLRHIVSYDNLTSYQYIKQYPHIHQMVDLTPYKSKIHPNLYLDYLYDHILKQPPGWVLVLDDDDKFMTDHALNHVKQYLVDFKTIIIWMLYRADKFIYPQDHSAPVVGEIGSCCYLYHTSTIHKGHWGGNAIGDFTFFRYLFHHVAKHQYIDLPLTGVNYQQQVSGWTAM